METGPCPPDTITCAFYLEPLMRVRESLVFKLLGGIFCTCSQTYQDILDGSRNRHGEARGVEEGDRFKNKKLGAMGQ